MFHVKHYFSNLRLFLVIVPPTPFAILHFLLQSLLSQVNCFERHRVKFHAPLCTLRPPQLTIRTTSRSHVRVLRGVVLRWIFGLLRLTHSWFIGIRHGCFLAIFSATYFENFIKTKHNCMFFSEIIVPNSEKHIIKIFVVQPKKLLLIHGASSQRSRKIRLRTTSRSGHTRE